VNGVAGNDGGFGWGIAGPGGIARTVGAVMAATPGMRVAAVGSRSLERARVLADDLGADAAYGSYRELVEDPAVQAVYVATPHTHHLPVAALAIEAGKAVLCEKPMAADVADAERLIAFARERGVFLMEAMWTRFSPLIRRAVALIGAGAIGEPRSVHAAFGFPAAYDPAHRLWDPALGGGALLDVGVYPITLAHLVFGAPESMSVAGTLAPGGVDAEAAVLMRWAGGARAFVETSLLSPLPLTASIVGTTGRIDIGEPFYAPTRIVVHGVGGSAEEYAIGNPDVALAAELAEVRDGVAAGRIESAIMPWSETLSVLRTVEAVREQLARHAAR